MGRLLITGGAGFIGANFVRYWLDRFPGDRVVVLDALTYAGHLSSLEAVGDNPAFRFVRGDIRDQSLVEDLLTKEKLDTLVNFAAESHVDRSIAGPDAFVDTNIVGAHRLLGAAKNVWMGNACQGGRFRFHHVSTDEVYGSLAPDQPAFDEDSPYRPSSPYAASKAASDHLVLAFWRTYGLPVTISNCTNNFGPNQHPEKLVPLMLVNALLGRPLPIYSTGENVRDWFYVADHCRGLEAVLRAGRLGETYNLGAGNERRNIDVVKLLCALLDGRFRDDPGLSERFAASPAAAGVPCETLIKFVDDRPGHDFRYALDCRKAAGSIGFEATESFEAGLAKTVDWYLKNERWWRDIMEDRDDTGRSAAFDE